MSDIVNVKHVNCDRFWCDAQRITVYKHLFLKLISDFAQEDFTSVSLGVPMKAEDIKAVKKGRRYYSIAYNFRSYDHSILKLYRFQELFSIQVTRK